MKREEFEIFLNKKVAVEIPHRLEAGKTFAYFGIVTNIYENYIVLDRNGKKTMINFDQIKEIREEY
jgi:ribosome maturation factor RimP